MIKDLKTKFIDKVIKNILKNNLNLVNKRTLQSSKKEIEEFLNRLQTIKAINRYSLSDFYVYRDFVVLHKGYSYFCVAYCLTLDIFFTKSYDSIRISFEIHVNK